MEKSKEQFLDYKMWRLEKDFERISTLESLRNRNKDFDLENENVKLWNKLREDGE